MPSSPLVLILMATFNGAGCLEAQVGSILDQTVEAWELWIRDDGSCDQTVGLAKSFAAKDPRIRLVEDDLRGGSALRNFSILLDRARSESQARYIAFADQDDVWLKDKLETTIGEIQRQEAMETAQAPCAVFTDASVVDADLLPISPSFWAMERIDPAVDCTLQGLMSRNPALGCTLMINRALLEIACPIPESAVMHDWWLVLSAKVWGRVGHSRSPSMLYIQHGGNQVGVKNKSVLHSVLAVAKNPLAMLARVRALHRASLMQAESLLQRDLPGEARKTIELFVLVRKSGLAMRLRHAHLFRSRSFVFNMANLLIG